MELKCFSSPSTILAHCPQPIIRPVIQTLLRCLEIHWMAANRSCPFNGFYLSCVYCFIIVFCVLSLAWNMNTECLFMGKTACDVEWSLSTSWKDRYLKALCVSVWVVCVSPSQYWLKIVLVLRYCSAAWCFSKRIPRLGCTMWCQSASLIHSVNASYRWCYFIYLLNIVTVYPTLVLLWAPELLIKEMSTLKSELWHFCNIKKTQNGHILTMASKR